MPVKEKTCMYAAGDTATRTTLGRQGRRRSCMRAIMPAAAALPCSPLRRALLLSALAITVLLHQARCVPAAVARTNNLTAGAALTPPGYITSPSGDFAFGFRALDAHPTKFVLATWFRFRFVDDDAAGAGTGISSQQPQPQSVVWFAKQSPPYGGTPFATANSVLRVTPDGTLAITDGNQELWRAPTTMLRRGSVLVLRDSGNLQFLGDGGDVLWESFWYPTDTLLPGQSLALDAMSQGKLISKRADAEFTTGRFSLGVQSDGNVVLYVDLLAGNNPGNAYWQEFTNSPDGNTTVTFDAQGRLNYTLSNGTVYSLISPPATASFTTGADYFQFVRMDPDGVVRTYAHARNKTGKSSSWTRLSQWPPDGCNKRTSGLQGMCGPGSYCVQTDDRLNCLCPSGYNYTDAQHPDSGCTPAFEPQSCGGEESSADEFTLVELPNITWETSIYYKKFSSVSEEQCRDYCLSDCFCVAALFIGNADCAEIAVLTNGRRANDVTMKAFIKVRTGSGQVVARTRTVLGLYRIVTICMALLLVITIGGLLAHHYLGRNRNRNRESTQLLSTSVRAFSWNELYQATNGFEKLLGKGSFGEVYQGTIQSPQEPHVIAVKKLIDSNEYGEQEFTNEVQSIGQIHHRNLVRMIGYCKEGKHRMLVFEFMPGGSLRSFLFNPEKRPPWQWRADAALAIARGLEYLHDGCSAPIIHCDIKPENILIDGHGVPRITDFGISKLLGTQQVHTTVTHVRGTRGYIAPEWLLGDGHVDTKADVYSFGVVLLEMISCRRSHEPVVSADDEVADGGDNDGKGMLTLVGWAAQLVGAHRTEIMLQADGDDVDTVEDMEKAERFARVALWCVETNPALRPTMHKVVQMLEASPVDRAQFETLQAGTQSCYTESSPLMPQLGIQ